jgi:hypothetical protein
MFPLCGIAFSGVNVMKKVLVPPGCIVAPAGFTVNVPFPDATLPITSGANPVSITVTLSSLEPPTTTLPNSTVLRFTENPAVPPVPLTVMVSCAPGALWLKTMVPVCGYVFAGVNVR